MRSTFPTSETRSMPTIHRGSVIVAGTFSGGEIEPGTFHGGEIEPGTFHGTPTDEAVQDDLDLDRPLRNPAPDPQP